MIVEVVGFKLAGSLIAAMRRKGTGREIAIFYFLFVCLLVFRPSPSGRDFYLDNVFLDAAFCGVLISTFPNCAIRRALIFAAIVASIINFAEWVEYPTPFHFIYDRFQMAVQSLVVLEVVAMVCFSEKTIDVHALRTVKGFQRDRQKQRGLRRGLTGAFRLLPDARRSAWSFNRVDRNRKNKRV